MKLKKISKKIENIIRQVLYSIIRFFFKNKPLTIPVNTEKIKKILIFRYDAIGDFVVTTSLFKLFKDKINNCEISVLASNRNKDLSLNHSLVDKTFVYDGSIKSLINNIFELRKEKYDLIFAGVFFRTTFSGLLANLIGGRNSIKACIGHETRNKQYSTFFNLIVLPAPRGTVSMAYLQQLIFIRAFGWSESSLVLKNCLDINPEIEKEVKKNISKLGNNKKVLLNISARNTWSLENNILFLMLFFEKYYDYKIIISYMETDKEKAENIKKLFSDNLIIYKSEKGIMELISLINNCDIVISPDTSIPHISAALNKPTIDIYPKIGTTHIAEWSPIGDFVEIVTTEENRYINDITPQSVLDTFQILNNKINERA